MSDSDSKDSDEGIRYKTDSVRTKKSTSKKTSLEIKLPGRHTKTYKQSKSGTHKRSSQSPPLKKCKKKNKRRKERNSDSSSSSSEEENNLRTNINNIGEKNLIINPITNNANFGPAVPPHLQENTENITDEEDKPKILIGPVIPTHLLSKKEDVFGPELPSQNVNHDNLHDSEGVMSSKELTQSDAKNEVRVLGPQLPPHLQRNCEKDITKTVGPTLPSVQDVYEHHSTENTDEEEFYGPLPSGVIGHSTAQKALEERALQLKIDRLEPKGNEEPVRETWMLELPSAKASHLGLGPRQFRNRSGPDMSDRSAWTDTPTTKNKKQKNTTDIKVEAELKHIQNRDKEQEQLVKKHKKKDKSLMEIHQHKLDQQKQAAGPSERKPFNRETDLQVNRFDEAQKKAILKKAQLLDDRFSSGKSKYL